jgi:hypothetical protein
LSLTLAVKNLPSKPEHFRRCLGPLFIAGWLWLDADGARLYDWDSDASVPLCDPEAWSAIRSAIPAPADYLTGALLQVFVREGASGPELHTAYWVQFFEPSESGKDRWGICVNVRPVPPEHDYIR